MKQLKILTAIFLLSALTAYAEEETGKSFPKTGYVKNDGSEVKAGDNVNFENLCVLSKSDIVKVVDKRYSWFKVLLPKKAFVYINKDFVDLTSDEKGIGIINGRNVNLRAGAGTRYSIVSQVSKPEKVSIVSEESGWYKIEPPYGATGWMHSSLLALKEGEASQAEQKSGQKKAEPAPVKTKGATIRLDKNYPAPKGNLSITDP
ncbi:MAG: SH3 domain-containing protein [Candidatus Omnitrophota bacterium]|jgi:uncharacterized protein YgiM (DUF1202 family)